MSQHFSSFRKQTSRRNLEIWQQVSATLDNFSLVIFSSIPGSIPISPLLKCLLNELTVRIVKPAAAGKSPPLSRV